MNKKSWIYILAAMWILIAAMVNFSMEGNLWVNVTAGLVVWVAAFFDVYRAGEHAGKMYGALGALAVGTWLALTGFLPACTGNFTLFLMNNALMALLLAYIGAVTMDEYGMPARRDDAAYDPARHITGVEYQH